MYIPTEGVAATAEAYVAHRLAGFRSRRSEGSVSHGERFVEGIVRRYTDSIRGECALALNEWLCYRFLLVARYCTCAD